MHVSVISAHHSLMLSLANHLYIPLESCTVTYAMDFKINCQKRKNGMIV